MSHPRITSWSLVVGLPLVCWAVAVLIGLGWRDDLPDPLAVHFGLTGTPDGYASLGGQLLVFSLLVVGLVALFAVLGAPSSRPPAIRRAAAGLSTGIAVFLSALHLILLAEQRGLADASQATLNPWWLLPAAAAAVLIGYLVSLIGRTTTVTGSAQAPPPEALRIALAPGSRAVWSRSQSMSTVGNTIPLALAAVFVVIGVVGRFWPLLIVAVIVLVLFAAMGFWTVTVDDQGLRYRSVLGWPRRHVPLERIAAAEVITARPLKDSGGWGLRMNREGHFGLYLRSGPALLVRTVDGGGTVVTVDDAETAAGLLNSLLDRVR
ncbi:DUF1648 domain-containing protein [Nakamurella silvestris]|nr:DUF1648 domain-containing protein [Nakamurella silvestris]